MTALPNICIFSFYMVWFPTVDLNSLSQLVNSISHYPFIASCTFTGYSCRQRSHIAHMIQNQSISQASGTNVFKLQLLQFLEALVSGRGRTRPPQLISIYLINKLVVLLNSALASAADFKSNRN